MEEIKTSKMNEQAAANALYTAQMAAKLLADTEKNFGDRYESEDRRAEEVQAIRQALHTAIEAAANLYAYELESLAFVEAEASKQ